MNDLISRDDLIKSIDFDIPLNHDERDTLNLVLKRIKALPAYDREELALEALKDVKAKIHAVGVLDSEDSKVAFAYGNAEAIIDHKIKEVSKCSKIIDKKVNEKGDKE